MFYMSIKFIRDLEVIYKWWLLSLLSCWMKDSLLTANMYPCVLGKKENNSCSEEKNTI